MCTGIEIAMLAGTAMSAGSSLNSGFKSAEAGIEQKALNEIDARAEIASAQNTVKQIRRQKQAVQGAARAAYAAAGVQVDTGTAGTVDKDIGARAAQDMYQVMVEGRQRAALIRAQGRAAEKQGRAAMTAGALEATSTALGAYGTVKGWK